jgi:hypothetical protein
VGFGREAKRVRDRALPTRYRLHALGSCIQLAQPIGFNATWSYLQEKAQRSWREQEFLVPAMDLLESERGVHLSIEADYARVRREQKVAGARFPPRCDVTPKDPFRWHGDERAGALHALATWRRLRPDQEVTAHAFGQPVLAAVDSALAAQHQPVLDLDELQAILGWARRQIHVIGWEADRAEYRVAWDVYRLLGQLHLLAHGVTPIARPWNFRVD